jgi:hypothetical protein
MPELLSIAQDTATPRSARTGAEGRARFDDLPVGRYEISAQSSTSGESPLEARAFAIVAPEPTVVRLELLAAPDLVVRVLDGANAPVAAAAVELTAGLERARADVGGAELLRATSDEHGEARFADRGYSGLIVLARAPDGRAGSAIVWTRGGVEHALRRGGVDVVVGATAVLEGRLTGLDPAQLDGASVVARLLTTSQPHYTAHGRAFATAVARGRYRFAELAPGTYTLGLDDPRGARLVLPPLSFGGPLPNSVDPLEVTLASGERATRDLAVELGATIEGTVRDPSGAPLAGARVRATFAPATSNFPDGFVVRGVNVWRYDHPGSGDDDHPDSHWRARSDAAGRYRLTGLPAGSLRVEVASTGLTYDRREAVPLRAGETKLLAHVLEPAGSIRGISRRGGYLGVTRADQPEPRMIAILPADGSFCFPGLEPGSWTVAAFHSSSDIAPVVLCTVEVSAGRETWLDLDRIAALPVLIRGRVVDARGAVAGARVRNGYLAVTTASDGSFEFRSAFAHTMQVGFEVRHAGVTTGLQFPGMEREERSWNGELELGAERLDVRTLDADGAPSTAVLHIWCSDFERSEVRECSIEAASVDAGGQRTLEGLFRGAARVTAEFADGALAEAEVTLPHDEPLLLRAPACGSLVIDVRHADGSPAAEVEVSAATWTGADAPPDDRDSFRERAHLRGAVTGRDGRAVIAGVVAGEVLVEAFSTRMRVAFEPNPSTWTRLPLARGERAELRLVLPPE